MSDFKHPTMTITDEIRERVAIEVSDLPPELAQAEYDKRIAELESVRPEVKE